MPADAIAYATLMACHSIRWPAHYDATMMMPLQAFAAYFRLMLMRRCRHTMRHTFMRAVADTPYYAADAATRRVLRAR